MRTRNQSRSIREGSVLMVSVMSVSIIGIMLAAYLSLISAQNLSVARSQAWNAAIPVVEFGIEEALAQLNQNDVANLASDGWSQGADGIQFTKFRAVGDANVFIIISNVSPPVIYAFGYVPIPLQNSNYVERVVRVSTARNNLFAKGILSQGQITMDGNALIDSFDSTDPRYSTNGNYSATLRKAGAGIATDAGLTNIMLTGNAQIYGNLNTGPGGTIGIGPNGKVGDLSWMANLGATGVEPGASRNDMNVAFPDVTPPFSSAFAPGAGQGNQYLFTSSGNYEVPSISKSIEVQSGANVVLLVDGNIDIHGNSQVQVDQGGSLTIYMNGQSASFGGNGVINTSGNATNFAFFGTPNNTKVSISGSDQFSGVIYAPEADMTMNGGGNSLDVVGSVVSKSVKINGHFQFHYDESLARQMTAKGFIANSWDEL